MSLAHRTGTSIAGPQKARLVQCPKSQFHGFFPENEPCPLCAPAPVQTEDAWADDIEWWVLSDGTLTWYNRPFIEQPVPRSGLMNNGALPLRLCAPEGTLASRLCGCYYNGKHRMFRHNLTGVEIRLCRFPTAVKSLDYKEIP